MKKKIKHFIAFAVLLMVTAGGAWAQSDKPNILFIWGDDIGIWNISHNNRGMMGYKTPNIDRIAQEGIGFTDYYGQQSCTAGRAAFLNGSVPVRTGMTKVGMPAAEQGWQYTDVTIATVLKSLGYTTGQFGKNHQGDRDEHLPTHIKDEHRGLSGPSGDDYHDGMVEHDMHVGELLALIDELGLAENTIVMYSTDNGPHFNTWPDAAITPFHGEKNSNWEGAFRVPCFIRWPGQWPANVTLNGIVSHEDWLPTFAAVAGNEQIVEQLRKGVELNGRTYRNYIDGVNLLDYLTGKTSESPRKQFIYTDDGGQVVAIRVGDWKAVYLENRADRLQIWKEPFISLRAPDLYNLRRDPFEKAKIGSNTYEDWYIDRAYMLGPMQVVASRFLMTLQDYPPSQLPGDWSLETLEHQIKSMTKGSL